MGSACCTKKSVSVQPSHLRPDQNSSFSRSLPAIEDLNRTKKSQLFYNDGSESTFMDVSSSRTGKLIK